PGRSVRRAALGRHGAPAQAPLAFRVPNVDDAADYVAVDRARERIGPLRRGGAKRDAVAAQARRAPLGHGSSRPDGKRVEAHIDLLVALIDREDIGLGAAVDLEPPLA